MSDALAAMSATELTSQLDRSELKEEASKNAARQRSASDQDSMPTSKGREATAPPAMLVTLLTSHRERSLSKSEHW